MSWLSILIAVAILIALVAATGARPPGGRPVAGTRLMSAGRVVLVLLVIVIVWTTWGR
jgi:hypothetical protein